MPVSTKRIKAIQAECGLSTEEMAEKLSISASHYRTKLRGGRGFTLHDIETIHDISGKSFDYIMGL